MSAAVAVAVSSWLKKKWADRVPIQFQAKDKNQLINQYRANFKIAHWLALLGFCVGALPYVTHSLSDHDWRGLVIAFGLACFLPLAYFIITNAPRGGDAIKESLIAYAMWQKIPPTLLFTLMALACAAGVVSAASLLI